MKNEKIIKRIRTYICVLFVLLCCGFALAFTKNKIKAETSFYDEMNLFKSHYYLDYVNTANYNDYGLTITNNKDGSFLINGTTTAVVKYRILFNYPIEYRFCETTPYNEGMAYGNIFAYDNTTKEPADYSVLSGITMRIGSGQTSGTGSQEMAFSGTLGYFGANTSSWLLTIPVGDYSGGLRNGAGYEKYIDIYFASNKTYNNVLAIPFALIDLQSNTVSGRPMVSGGGPRAIYEYIASIVGPKANTDVYYASSKTNAGYYIYQKINSQFGVSILPAIRYTLTADTTELTAETTALQDSAYINTNIDILKLTGANGNIYGVYYDNITESNTKGSYFVNDNGTTTILQNADGSGLLISTGLDAFIVAMQHALTNSATITTADHYTFNLCSLIYVFDTDFGYAKGVAEGSANYQPGQPGYQSIYDAGKDYGEEQKDLYYGNYYGGSNGIGGAGYTGIYNAGKEAGARITTNWLYEILNTIVVVFGLELLPGIKLGYIVGAPVVISTIWFIIRQFSGGKNE